MIPKQLIKNFLSLFLSNVAGQIFTLLGFIHLATVLGPGGFGEFSFAQVVVLYFLFLADFGLQTLGTRVVAQGQTKISDVARDITTLRIVLAFVSFILLILLVSTIPELAQTESLILVFSLALWPSALLLEWVFLGIEQMAFVGLARTLKGVIFWSLVYLSISEPSEVTLAATYYVLGIAAGAGILLFFYVKRFGLLFGGIRVARLKETLSAAAPLAGGSLLGQVNYNFGTVALGFLLTSAAVGLFSAAYRIVLFLLAFGLVAASNAVLPLLSRSYKNSTSEFSSSIKKLLRLFVFVAIPTGVGGSILASRIMSFLYPPEYQQAVLVFQLAIWMVVLATYRTVFETALIASSSQQRYFKGYVLSGTLTVFGSIILIPILGFIAPAIVGIASELLLLLYFALSCKFVRLSFLAKTSLKPVLAGLLMGTALLYFPLSLFAALGVGFILYFALLILFRCLTLHEVVNYLRIN